MTIQLHPTKGAAMTAAPPPAPEVSPCPHYSDVCERLVITEEGAFLACEECARRQGYTGSMLTREEWEAQDDVRAALAAFGIERYDVTKSGFTPTLRPRAHVWHVSTGGERLLLKRWDDAAAEAAIDQEGAIRTHLAARLPVAPFRQTSSGATLWANGGAPYWTLCAAPRGAPFGNDVLLWNSAGSISDTLALMHNLLPTSLVAEAAPTAWDEWTLKQLHTRLAAWPKLADLTYELRDQAIERLETMNTFAKLPTLPKVIMHGNFGRAAIFWSGFAVTGICEFDRVHCGPAICDLATGLVNQFRPIVRAAIIGYAHERKLEDVDLEVLPEALLLGTLMRIDRQLTVWHDKTAANGYAEAITQLLKDADGLRKLQTTTKKAAPESGS
jgi:Ser/Thr protein kinase RdoA (MazF antagonist)